MDKCQCINEFIRKIKTEDTSYLNPLKWDYSKYYNTMCCIQSKTSIELENIKRDLNEIKKLYGYNINPLFDKDTNNKSNDDSSTNSNESIDTKRSNIETKRINIDITSDEIKTTIIELKDEIQELNYKINQIEESVNHSIGTDAFCIIEKDDKNMNE